MRLFYVLSLLFFTNLALANERVIVPFPAGGGTDLAARIIFKNSNIKIENIGGAGGDIGRQKALRDNVLLFTPNSLLISAHLLKAKVSPLDEFKPVVGIGAYPYLISAHPNFSINNLNMLKSIAAKHGAINIGSAGVAGANNIIIYELARVIGFKVQAIPHRGTTDALLNTISGNVPMMVSGIQGTNEMIKSGKLKPVAVSTNRRDVIMKDVPTVEEMIKKPFNYPGWFGVVVSKNYDDNKLKTVQEYISNELKNPEIIKQLNELSINIWNYSPEVFYKFLKKDDQQWKNAISKIN